MRKTAAGRLVGTDNHVFPFEPAADMGPALRDPLFVVCHYTASASESVDRRVLTRQDRTYVSAHFLIARDGTVTQMVPLDRVAWHAGHSEWRHGGQLHKNLNGCSIGIEFSNAGWLDEWDAGAAWRPDLGARIPLDRTIAADHPNGWPKGVRWETYTDRQIEKGRGLIALLRQALPSLVEVVGHDQIAPDRKQDPGPAFPLAAMRAALHEGD